MHESRNFEMIHIFYERTRRFLDPSAVPTARLREIPIQQCSAPKKGLELESGDGDGRIDQMGPLSHPDPDPAQHSSDSVFLWSASAAPLCCSDRRRTRQVYYQRSNTWRLFYPSSIGSPRERSGVQRRYVWPVVSRRGSTRMLVCHSTLVKMNV